MKLSIYTFVRDGIRYDYHVVAMLRHHLQLADEIIVNEGFSSDGTYEAIRELDPKIKVFRSEWGAANRSDWFVRFKEQARRKCSGDWCILLDCDEFIPEWEFEPLRAYLESTDQDLVPVRVVNFYGNYRVFHKRPEKVAWPARKMIIHRNRPDMEVWGDGSNVMASGKPAAWDSPVWFTCHHFGFVRHAARLREKWRILGKGVYLGRPSWVTVPSIVFDVRPHKWLDATFLGDLEIYAGKSIRAVREEPDEFVRDGYRVYEFLRLRRDA